MMIPSAAAFTAGSDERSDRTLQSIPDNINKGREVALDQSLFNYFTENKGQWSDDVNFLASTSFGSAEFNSNGFFYALTTPDGNAREVASFTFIGANQVVPIGIGPVSSSNYFLGEDAGLWQSGVNNYAEISYPNLWSGIDLYFQFSNGYLKYEFHVQPHANTADIQILVGGADLLSDGGQLTISTPSNSVSDGPLVSYYTDNSGTVPTSFAVVGSTYSFLVGPRDEGKELIIDPVVNSLVYSTFIGGLYEDRALAIAVDTSGSSFVTGSTMSADFPTTVGAYDITFNGNLDTSA